MKLEMLKWHLLWKWRGTRSDGAVYHHEAPDTPGYLNILGDRKHIARCSICGDSFDWKAHHYIGFTHAFPYCEECHCTKGIVPKVKAMFELTKEWYDMDPESLWTYRGLGGYIRVLLFSVLGILLGQ